MSSIEGRRKGKNGGEMMKRVGTKRAILNLPALVYVAK